MIQCAIIHTFYPVRYFEINKKQKSGNYFEIKKKNTDQMLKFCNLFFFFTEF